MSKRVHITMSRKALQAEQDSKNYRQCGRVFLTKTKSYIFCLRNHGHEGNHRGIGAEWTDSLPKGTL